MSRLQIEQKSLGTYSNSQAKAKQHINICQHFKHKGAVLLQKTEMEIVCHFSIWGLLAFVTMALVVSLIINISYCIANKQQGYRYRDYPEYSPSYDDDYTEECPVYGNLNQEILALDECCYEQMKARPRRFANEVKVEAESQMCYASLDHSIKEKHRKPRKKKAPLEVNEEEMPSKTNTLASQNSIYLNSDQLAAENQPTEEAIHDDPIRLFGLIHTTSKEDPCFN